MQKRTSWSELLRRAVKAGCHGEELYYLGLMRKEAEEDGIFLRLGRLDEYCPILLRCLEEATTVGVKSSAASLLELCMTRAASVCSRDPRALQMMQTFAACMRYEDVSVVQHVLNCAVRVMAPVQLLYGSPDTSLAFLNAARGFGEELMKRACVLMPPEEFTLGTAHHWTVAAALFQAFTCIATLRLDMQPVLIRLLAAYGKGQGMVAVQEDALPSVHWYLMAVKACISEASLFSAEDAFRLCLDSAVSVLRELHAFPKSWLLPKLKIVREESNGSFSCTVYLTARGGRVPSTRTCTNGFFDNCVHAPALDILASAARLRQALPLDHLPCSFLVMWWTLRDICNTVMDRPFHLRPLEYAIRDGWLCLDLDKDAVWTPDGVPSFPNLRTILPSILTRRILLENKGLLAYVATQDLMEMPYIDHAIEEELAGRARWSFARRTWTILVVRGACEK